jgi:mismatch-specific thymine-DNA glycosylase
MARKIWLNGYQTLDDILAEDLDILFIGYNPSPLAVERGHYYARRSNRFWEDLYEAGLVPKVLRGPDEDLELLEYGLGLADLVKRPTPNIDDVSKDEFRQGIARLDEILRRYRPKILCFNGLGLQKMYQKMGHPPETIRVIGLPSSSPRVIGMRAQRLQALRELAVMKEGLGSANIR